MLRIHLICIPNTYSNITEKLYQKTYSNTFGKGYLNKNTNTFKNYSKHISTVKQILIV